jgi:hypothetical protein
MAHTIFRIQNCLSDLFLDVPQVQSPINDLHSQVGNKPGTDLIQYTEDTSNASNQEWYLQFVPATDIESTTGGFQIVHVPSQLVVGVNSTKSGPGSVELQSVMSEGTPGIDEQLWLPLEPPLSSDGYYLINLGTNQVLDVPMHEGDGKKAGMALQQYPKNSGDNQQWNLVQAPGHTHPEVTVSPVANVGPGSTLNISGTGFVDYVGKELYIMFYGIPLTGNPSETSLGALGWGNGAGGQVTVKNGGTFSWNMTTPYYYDGGPPDLSGPLAASNWASCYVLSAAAAASGKLLGLTSVQIEYFVSIN